MINSQFSVLSAIALLALSGTHSFADSIEEDFENPPVAVRPYVWWHWMGTNISKEGITKDLESMKASGIGGATIFNLSSAVHESNVPTRNLPWPEITYRSPKWREMVQFAASEAQRLGLEGGMLKLGDAETVDAGDWSLASNSQGQPIVRSAVKLRGSLAFASGKQLVQT